MNLRQVKYSHTAPFPTNIHESKLMNPDYSLHYSKVNFEILIRIRLIF